MYHLHTLKHVSYISYWRCYSLPLRMPIIYQPKNISIQWFNKHDYISRLIETILLGYDTYNDQANSIFFLKVLFFSSFRLYFLYFFFKSVSIHDSFVYLLFLILCVVYVLLSLYIMCIVHVRRRLNISCNNLCLLNLLNLFQ